MVKKIYATLTSLLSDRIQALTSGVVQTPNVMKGRAHLPCRLSRQSVSDLR